MSKCSDLEPMFAPYVDGATEPQARAAVEAHLSKCPPCRERVTVERVAREMVHARRDSLRGCASDHLRSRCAAQRAVATIGAAAARFRSPSFVRRTLVPLSLAASIVLVASILFITLGKQVEVLAAQFAADHVKCFQFSSTDVAQPPPDAGLLSQKWARERGWSLKIPASTADYDLELLGIRRCGSTDGTAAHMMYRWRGEPLSVYVMNNESKRAREQEQFVETLGKDAVIWKHAGRTYAIVADASRSDLEPVVRYVRASAR
jgi:anti-sigma factor RsiW